MRPFKNEYAKLAANVSGSGMNAELRTTCRGRASILGPRQLTHKQTGFWHWVIFGDAGLAARQRRVTQTMVNAAGNGDVVSITTGEVTSMGENGSDLKGDIKTNLTHIGPRIGIAYQVRPRTVIRMGYGRSLKRLFKR